MSGALACACSALGMGTMAESVGSISDVPIRNPGRTASPANSSATAASRARRGWKSFSRIAAVGVSECSAWIVPILERSDVNEDPGME